MSTGKANSAPTAVQDVFAAFRGDDRLMTFIGRLAIRDRENGISLRVEPNEGALNPLGILHGGALSALFDVAMYEAAKRGGEVVTVAQETKFLAAINGDAPLFIEADLLREGRKTVFCTAKAVQSDKLCGHATAQFARYASAQT